MRLRRGLAALLLAAVLPGFAVAAGTPPAATSEEGDPALTGDLLDDAIAIIQRDFLRELSREEIQRRALRALLADLDPYSRYLDAEAWDDHGRNLAAQFAGVGVQLRMDDETGLPQILYLVIDSAAGAAGARRGDWIEAIDGKALAGLGLDSVPPLLRGAAGSSVELALRRPPGNQLLSIRFERKVHRFGSIHGAGRDAAGRMSYLLDRGDAIGYVRISHLAEDSLDGVEAALCELEARGARGLVLDLRDSTGGLFMQALRIADLFIDQGPIAGDQARTGSEWFNAEDGIANSLPMVVLINEFTASSSEFLAAALKDHGRARFIGQRTYGKALLQGRYALSEGQGGMLLSKSRLMRPSGLAADRHDPAPDNERAGVVPDEGLEFVVAGDEYERWRTKVSLREGSVQLTAEDFADEWPDRMLDRAVEVLESSLGSGSR